MEYPNMRLEKLCQRKMSNVYVWRQRNMSNVYACLCLSVYVYI